MKKIKYVSILLVLFATACCHNEQIPAGLILKDAINTKDSTYILSTVPAKQPKKILIEEATGVLCTNCPDGAKALRDLEALHPNKIIPAAVYSPFLNDFQAPAKYDFNTTDAYDLVTFVEGSDVSKPSACIDRVYSGGAPAYYYKLSDWSSVLGSLLSKTTPLNIDVTATPTANTNEYLIKSTVTFTEAWSGDIALSLFLIEDKVIDYQDSSVVVLPNYEHNHILRKIITPVSGATFTGAVTNKEVGRVYEKFVTFTLPANIVDKSNCKIIGFVHKTGTSKEVIHVEEIDL